MTITEYLAQVKERAEAATDGPWSFNTSLMTTARVWMDTPDEGLYLSCNYEFAKPNMANETRFIAHARTDVPVLLEMVELLIKHLDMQHYFHVDESCKEAVLKLESLVPGGE